MNPESHDPQELNQAVGITVPAIGNNTADDLPFYRIPTPPVPGKTAWSLSPWLPE